MSSNQAGAHPILWAFHNYGPTRDADIIHYFLNIKFYLTVFQLL